MAPAGIGDRVEGLHAVVAAQHAGRVRKLTIERQRLRHDAYVELFDAVRGSGATVAEVDDVRELAATSAPQGVVAECSPIPAWSLADVAELAEPAALLVVDRLQDPRNLGAIARSAWAAGVPGIVVAERRSAPIGATAFKAAAGALEHVAVAVVGSIADAVRQLKRSDIWTVGLVGDADTSLLGLDLLEEPVAIVLGAEGGGVSRLVRERLDHEVRIPMAAGVDSLNASIAASLAMYELARVRGWIS